MSGDLDLERKSISGSIIIVREQPVMLDSDLAELFGTNTKRLNQQVKRNIARFDEQFAFQMTKEEFDDLKSQNVTSSKQHGGRRVPPWVFTEHGIPMLSTVLTTPRSVEMLKLVIEVFVTTRAQILSGAGKALVPHTKSENVKWRQELRTNLLKLATTIGDFQINRRDGKSVKEEVEEITASVLDSVKAHINSKTISNEVLIAEIQQKIAETEKLRAEARKTHSEADAIDIANMRTQYELLSGAAEDLEQLDVTPVLGAMDAMKMIDLSPKKATGK